MREKDLTWWNYLTPTEKDSASLKALEGIPVPIIDEAAELGYYERVVVLSKYAKARQPARNLLDFTLATNELYKPEPVHALICEHLDAVVDGNLKRLMIFAPPQFGKSELASVRMPAYFLGRRPNDPVILTSYAASLAEDKSKQVRAIVESNEYAQIFPDVTTKEDSRAAGLWHLRPPHRGRLLAVGVGGAITGFGAMLALVDDPFENWESSQRVGERQRVYDWYRTTFRTRVWTGGAIVIINTRWHEADLCGMLLNERNARDWTVLRLPATAETPRERAKNNPRCGLDGNLPDPLGRIPGESLAPIRYPASELLEIKADVGLMAWNAEYQAAPRAPEGTLIKRDWFEIVDEIPTEGKVENKYHQPIIWRCRGWDKGGTQGGGDYTTGLMMVFDSREGIFYIEDIVRGQWDITHRLPQLKIAAERDEAFFGKFGFHIVHEQQPAGAGKDVALITNNFLKEWNVEAKLSSGSKEVRAGPAINAARNGFIKLKRAWWNDDFLDELCDFPNGVHDDQLDAFAIAYNWLVLKKPKKKIDIVVEQKDEDLD